MAHIKLLLKSVIFVAGFNWELYAAMPSKAFLRVDEPISYLKASPRGQYLAFSDANGNHLKLLNLVTNDVTTISQNYVGGAFFWTPDGKRVFFRNLVKKNSDIESYFYVFDTFSYQLNSVDSQKSESSFLTYDPRDQKMFYMLQSGLRSYRLDFPGERYALWQVTQKKNTTKFIATQKAIVILEDQNTSMRTLDDDKSGVESFQISPDGSTIVWATRAGNIYTSEIENQTPKWIDYGRDPSWHPVRKEIVYAGSRMVGKKAVSYDIKISNLTDSRKFITFSQHTSERWPSWDPKGETVYFTAEKTSDFYKIKL